jgi:hypothetical protein
MLWFFFRWLFWRPRFSYEIVVGTSHASAEEAARSAQLKTNAAGGEAIGIAADALCCADSVGGVADGGGNEAGVALAGPAIAVGSGSVEWDVYVLIRH